MSGYFQRLLARSAGAGAEIHPLSRLPHAGLPETEPLTLGSSGEFADAPPQSPGQTERHAAVAESPAPRPATPAALLRPPAPQMSKATAAEESAAMLTAPNLPPLIQTQALEVEIASRRTVPTTPAAHTVAPPQPPLERAAERFADESPEAPESFRLMVPHSLAHDADPSWPPLSFAPEAGAGRVQAATLALQARPSMRTQKNVPGKTETPEVHVSIGRIEVTAVQAPAPPKRKPATSRKALSLDDYLAQRGRA